MNLYTKDLLKQLVLALVLCIFLFFASTTKAGTLTETYSVEQEYITIKIAPKSGLTKASCKMFDFAGNKVMSQNVTVITDYLEQGLYIIEVNAYYEQHNIITAIQCK
jgi:hypothetical protein